MKEQVNVEIVEFVTISKEKYDRLKQIDENLKALILGLKHGLPNITDKNNEAIIKPIIELLESLDK